VTAESTRAFTAHELEDIQDLAGELGRGLKALGPTTLPEDVQASLLRLRACFLSLNDGRKGADVALAEESNLLLAATSAAPGVLVNLRQEAQDAAAALLGLFERP